MISAVAIQYGYDFSYTELLSHSDTHIHNYTYVPISDIEYFQMAFLNIYMQFYDLLTITNHKEKNPVFYCLTHSYKIICPL